MPCRSHWLQRCWHMPVNEEKSPLWWSCTMWHVTLYQGDQRNNVEKGTRRLWLPASWVKPYMEGLPQYRKCKMPVSIFPSYQKDPSFSPVRGVHHISSTVALSEWQFSDDVTHADAQHLLIPNCTTFQAEAYSWALEELLTYCVPNVYSAIFVLYVMSGCVWISAIHL